MEAGGLTGGAVVTARSAVAGNDGWDMTSLRSGLSASQSCSNGCISLDCRVFAEINSSYRLLGVRKPFSTLISGSDIKFLKPTIDLQ